MLKYRLIIAIAVFILCPVIWFTSSGFTDNGGSSGAGFYYNDDDNGSCGSGRNDGGCGSGQPNNVQGQVDDAHDELNENNPGENSRNRETPAPIATPSGGTAKEITGQGQDAGAADAPSGGGSGCTD